MCKKLHIILVYRICDDCRKKVSKLTVSDAEASCDDDAYLDPPEVFASLNQYLGEIRETQKIERITTAVKKVVDVKLRRNNCTVEREICFC
jgi:hypothetical protein